MEVAKKRVDFPHPTDQRVDLKGKSKPETIDFPMKYGSFFVFFPLNQPIDQFIANSRGFIWVYDGLSICEAWYIYLHDWVILGARVVNTGKYSSTIEQMGFRLFVFEIHHPAIKG